VIIFETNFEIKVTLTMDWNGYEKKQFFTIKGNKAIPLEKYFKEEVKLVCRV